MSCQTPAPTVMPNPSMIRSNLLNTRRRVPWRSACKEMKSPTQLPELRLGRRRLRMIRAGPPTATCIIEQVFQGPFSKRNGPKNLRKPAHGPRIVAQQLSPPHWAGLDCRSLPRRRRAIRRDGEQCWSHTHDTVQGGCESLPCLSPGLPGARRHVRAR